MSSERDPTIRTLADTVKLLNEIATHRLIANSDYLELRQIADAASRQVPDLVAAIGKLQGGRAPKRADD